MPTINAKIAAMSINFCFIFISSFPDLIGGFLNKKKIRATKNTETIFDKIFLSITIKRLAPIKEPMKATTANEAVCALMIILPLFSYLIKATTLITQDGNIFVPIANTGEIPVNKSAGKVIIAQLPT